jgi:hypothetical protein
VTIHNVDLPALDGREPLGFLAALGVLQLLSSECGVNAQLAFSEATGCAQLRSSLPSTASVAEALAGVLAEIPDGAVLPGASPGFPPPAVSGKDPLRQKPPGYRQLADEVRTRDPHTAEMWLPALVTDLALDNQERCAITPFSAPSGQQKLRTFFEKPLQEVQRNPDYIHQALTSWQRIKGITGEYLDHRVLRSNADDILGRNGQEQGVPGATWLAIMALPLFRLTGNGGQRASALWHRPAGRRALMIWPIWRTPLESSAVQVLITHPSLKPINDKPTVCTNDWQALGIMNVYGAERQRIPGRNFEGVLAPVSLTKTGTVRRR